MYISLIWITLILKNINTQLPIDQYLTHYWPISNATTYDEIGSADMFQGSLTIFTSDRFGNENSALALNGSLTQIPSGVYFDSTEFTISAWVYPKQVEHERIIIDFGNGPESDNIILALSDGTLNPVAKIYNRSTQVFFTISSQNLTLNQWQFLTTTFDGNNLRVYLNGALTANTFSLQSYTLTNIKRSKCYIGKSNWDSDGWMDSSFLLDDLRFYNKSLNQSETLELMYSNVTSKK